jgi:hypothetical protein
MALIQNLPKALLYGLGAFSTGSGLAFLFSSAQQPKNRKYGSYWHSLKHTLFNNWGGQIGHISAVITDSTNGEPTHAHFFGLVCEECGFVNANSVISSDRRLRTDNEICGRETLGFTWTTNENYLEAKNRFNKQ